MLIHEEVTEPRPGDPRSVPSGVPWTPSCWKQRDMERLLKRKEVIQFTFKKDNPNDIMEESLYHLKGISEVN